jgi:hypothetical protein
VADGNFKLEHMLIKNAEADIYLSDGQSFLVEDKQYQNHIATSVQSKQVMILLINIVHNGLIGYIQKPRCNNHRAMSQANSHNKDHLRATGIGACACARHGCFYPHSVVDFQKGERLAFVFHN